MSEYSIIIICVISKQLNGKTKSSQVQLQSIVLNTNFMNLREIAPHATNHVLKAVGVQARRIVKNSVKLVVVHNVMEEDASDQNQGNVAIYFVLEDVLDLSNLTVW